MIFTCVIRWFFLLLSPYISVLLITIVFVCKDLLIGTACRLKLVPKKSILFVELLPLTDEFAVDFGSVLCWEKPTTSCLWPLTDVFQLQIHWGWSAFVFCACDVTQLCSAKFCVTTTLHIFVFSLVTNEKLNEWRPLFIKQIPSHAEIQTYVFNEGSP